MLATLNKIGSLHNTCEDSFFVQETETHIFGGIFDGCSTGKKSAFASQLYAYVCEKNSLSFDISQYLLNHFLYTVQENILAISSLLSLNKDTELLTTMFLFKYDKITKELQLRCFGDGVYYINGNEIIIDQNNEPDYFSYHLYAYYEFESHFLKKYQVITHENVDSFAICSDGILSYQRNQYLEPIELNPNILIQDKMDSQNVLIRKHNILKRNNFVHSDDLTIIRYASDKL